ncbi:50S ribosomal protein L9 [Eubacterium oxidoreducens]|uniref:Large ribosomal subunit protein bL9 n=1 Tax=Eubacterium oxidoreducens TaxID=1732 RepID=A0A1G5ZZM3_EUBOX|nr:50S ribosomal protein L9 [Eubacterium oxidoreducens]SDB01668.1 large subunit ribosomal protein L9 [Eubacterium oxidoreducens]
MKVILLQDVKSLGKKGEIVQAADAYARNQLIPKKMAVEATPKNMNDLKLQKKNDDKIAQENYEAAVALKNNLEKEDTIVEIKMKSGTGGKPFGSVSTKEIAQKTKEQLGLELDKKKMVTESLKSFGVHEVTIKLHPKVKAVLRVKVTEE